MENTTKTEKPEHHHHHQQQRQQHQHQQPILRLRPSPAQAFELLHIRPALQRRQHFGSLRKLTPYESHGNTDTDKTGPSSSGTVSTTTTSTTFIDFSSNDYLGLAHSIQQQQKVHDAYYQQLPYHQKCFLGSTGSRLLTGDSVYAHSLEQRLAKYHQRPAALLCNSGYDANLAVLSCLVSHGANIILDELCHNSIQMGVRLGKPKNRKDNDNIVRQFQHNNMQDLEMLLKEMTSSSSSSSSSSDNTRFTTSIVIVVESIYSMDGDAAPIKEIMDLAVLYQASVVVDEAHGLGVYGSQGLGLLEELQLQTHPSLLCTVHTFGKAAGCHGAVICGSKALVEFLYNFGRPIVYSTSLPLHSLVCISSAYDTIMDNVGRELRRKVLDLVQEFRNLMLERVLNRCGPSSGISQVESYSPIQAIVLPGNQRCVDFCQNVKYISNNSIRLFPIRSPTVPKGQERIRVVVHAFNTSEQLEYLVTVMLSSFLSMGLLEGSSDDKRDTIYDTPLPRDWALSRL
jgi:8-amino-7-oxononanoate synthase